MKNRKEEAKNILASNARLISKDEAAQVNGMASELVDSTATVKVELPAGAINELLTSANNPESRRGIMSFSKGKLESGSIVVTGIRFGYSATTAGDDVATKTFTQTGIPADVANGVIEIKQAGIVVRTIAVSNLIVAGDAPQNLKDRVYELDAPFLLGRDLNTSIVFYRPEGIDGAVVAVSIEFVGMQLAAKRVA
ncbi:MAG: hypothetical protein R3279_07475 [Putridiphycobacter sp.]|nr:hypothetical protein [Putridiphycobacter sp.]